MAIHSAIMNLPVYSTSRNCPYIYLHNNFLELIISLLYSLVVRHTPAGKVQKTFERNIATPMQQQIKEIPKSQQFRTF
jgi:hypothetical protein